MRGCSQSARPRRQLGGLIWERERPRSGRLDSWLEPTKQPQLVETLNTMDPIGISPILMLFGQLPSLNAEQSMQLHRLLPLVLQLSTLPLLLAITWFTTQLRIRLPILRPGRSNSKSIT